VHAADNYDDGHKSRPYRSLDGGNTFIDLTTRWDSGAESLRDWRIVAGWVTSVGTGLKEGALLIHVDKGNSTLGVAGGEEAKIVHLMNYPGAYQVVDGRHIICMAKCIGRYQYTTVQGATATVLSYDHGALPTPEQFASFENMKRTNYVAAAQTAWLARSNRLARQKMSSQNLSNLTITPRRP